MEQNEPDWRRLGEMVRDARIRRGYRTQRALAEAMDVSSKLINNIELGKNTSYSPTSLIALEIALGWQRGSVQTILTGGDPVDDKLTVTRDDLQRLANQVRLRRQESGLSLEDVAVRADLPMSTIEAIEAGKFIPYEKLLSSLEQAMGWSQGSALRVLQGKDPFVWPGPPPKPLSQYQIIARRGARRANQPPAAPPRETRGTLRDLSDDDLFDEWADLFVQSLGIEVEYARRRGFRQPAEAREELIGTIFMAQQGKDGRPWAPPWQKEMSDDEAHDQMDSLREAGLIDDRGEPIEQEDDTPPHPIPEPELDDGYLRDLGAAAREGDDSEPRPSDPDM